MDTWGKECMSKALDDHYRKVMSPGQKSSTSLRSTSVDSLPTSQSAEGTHDSDELDGLPTYRSLMPTSPRSLPKKQRSVEIENSSTGLNGRAGERGDLSGPKAAAVQTSTARRSRSARTSEGVARAAALLAPFDTSFDTSEDDVRSSMRPTLSSRSHYLRESQVSGCIIGSSGGDARPTGFLLPSALRPMTVAIK